MQYKYSEVTGALLPLEEINKRGKQGLRLAVQIPFSPDMRQWYHLFEEIIDIPAEVVEKIDAKHIQFKRK